VGAIDRIQTKPGDPETLQIIDFKTTSRLNPREKLEERYGNQLRTYAWAVSRIAPNARLETHLVQIVPADSGVRAEIQEFEFAVDLPRAQAWIDDALEKSRAILENASAAIPLPDGKKCAKCEFRQQCPDKA
jgi:CRISPR/Cas system-associated exonuclease Cas4 (RecB family)